MCHRRPEGACPRARGLRAQAGIHCAVYLGDFHLPHRRLDPKPNTGRWGRNITARDTDLLSGPRGVGRPPARLDQGLHSSWSGSLPGPSKEAVRTSDPLQSPHRRPAGCRTLPPAPGATRCHLPWGSRLPLTPNVTHPTARWARCRDRGLLSTCSMPLAFLGAEITSHRSQSLKETRKTIYSQKKLNCGPSTL